MKKAILFLALLYPNFLIAENKMSDIFEMDLEDLMKVKVTVSNPVPETILEAPSIVSSLSVNTLRSLGVKTLIEALSYVPGFIVDKSVDGFYTIQIRGIADAKNQKILFLLNDRSYWLASNGRIPITDIGIEYVDTIEVIRGPGAVIYGTNASAGVIKVITRQDHGHSAKLDFDEYGSARLESYAGGKNVNLGLSLSQTKGKDILMSNGYGPYDPTIGNFTKTTQGYLSDSFDTVNGILTYKADEFFAQIHGYSTRHDGAFNRSPLIQAKALDQGGIMSVRYAKSYQDGFTSFYGAYNVGTITTMADNLFILTGQEANGRIEFDNNGRNNYRLSFGVHNQQQITSTVKIFSGIEWEERSTDDYLYRDEAHGDIINQIGNGIATTPGYDSILIFGKEKLVERSLFSQVDVDLSPVRFLIGARYTNNDLSGDKTTPRLGLVWSLSDGYSIKLLHSVGFNSPNFIQNRTIRADGHSVNSDVKAETAIATDLGINGHFNKLLWKVSLFEMKIKDPIVTKGGQYVNGEIYRRRGYDFDLDLRLDNLVGFMNATYISEGHSIISFDAGSYFVPKHEGKIGVIYALDRDNRVGLSWFGMGERASLSKWHRFDLNFSRNWQSYIFSFKVENIGRIRQTSPNIGAWEDDYLTFDEDRIVIGIRTESI